MSFGCCCGCPKVTLADYENTTEVDNFSTEGDPTPPATVFPYGRPDSFYNVSDPCGGENQLPCDEWPQAPRPTEAPSGDILHDQNTLHPAGTSTTVERCREGHKVVQAIKQWHGRRGFDFCEDGCTAEPDRYRTIAISAVYADSSVFGETVVTGTWTVERTYTVDRYSGGITLSDCVTQLVTDPTGYEGEEVWGPLMANAEKLGLVRFACGYFTVPSSPANALIDSFVTALNDYIDNGFNNPTEGPSLWRVSSYTQTNTSLGATVAYYDESEAVDHTLTLSVVLSDPYTFDNLRSDAVDLLEEWALNNNSYFPWRTDAWRGLGVLVTHRELPARSPDIGIVPCLMDDYRDPIADVNEVEPFAEGWIPTWTQMGWLDFAVREWIFPDGETFETAAATGIRLVQDGSVKGAPFTSGLPDRMFDWDHATWKSRWTGSEYSWEEHWFGAESGVINHGDWTDEVIPTTASQWTENYYAGLNHAGSVEIYTTSALVLQKHVEAVVAFPRHNFFRPCGADRWAMDTTKAACINSFDGSDDYAEGDTLTLGADLSADLADGDLVAIYGAPSGAPIRVFAVDGTPTDEDVTLGAELTAPEGIADTYAHWDAAYLAAGASAGYGILGKIRWPDTAGGLKGAICGRISITSATQAGADLDLVLSAAAAYLRTGDKIIFCAADASDTVLDDNGGAGHAVTVTDATHITISGLTRDAAKHIACIKSLGAPASLWHSTASRKDHVVQRWETVEATGGFDSPPTNTDGSHTGKVAFASTPNADKDANWVTATFPEAAPTTCGGKAAVLFIQRVVDPLYQVPIACSGTISVCPPYVEAMTDAKVASISAPALPEDASFNAMLPTTAHLPAGNNPSTNNPDPHDAAWSVCG